MQKRGGGRFGKYGDLKRKEKIRQNRLNPKGSIIATPPRDERKPSKQSKKRER